MPGASLHLPATAVPFAEWLSKWVWNHTVLASDTGSAACNLHPFGI